MASALRCGRYFLQQSWCFCEVLRRLVRLRMTAKLDDGFDALRAALKALGNRNA